MQTKHPSIIWTAYTHQHGLTKIQLVLQMPGWMLLKSLEKAKNLILSQVSGVEKVLAAGGRWPLTSNTRLVGKQRQVCWWSQQGPAPCSVFIISDVIATGLVVVHIFGIMCFEDRHHTREVFLSCGTLPSLRLLLQHLKRCSGGISLNLGAVYF